MAASQLLSPRKQPRQRRSRETVAALLDAATQVFARDGFASATTARIAARAGVSVGSLYQFFPNKESLLVALGQRHMELIHARMERALDAAALEGLTLEELVRGLVTAMLELHRAEPVLHRLLFLEVPRKPFLTEAKLAGERALLLRLERLLDRHAEVGVRDAHVAAAFVGQVVETLTHWYVLEAPEPVADGAAFLDEVTALVCAYLASGPRPGGAAGRAPATPYR